MKPLAFLLWALTGLTTAFSADLPPLKTALKAAHLFDGKSKTLLPNGIVLIEGNTITAAGSNIPIPEGTRIIDLGDATLSPGFMDAHTHLTLDYYSPPPKARKNDAAEGFQLHPARAGDAPGRLHHGARCR